MPETRAFRFARNLSWNMLGQTGLLAINFLATPYLVRGMGIEAYGVYILLQTAAGYLFLFSFGAGSATTKYAAEFKASGHGAGLRHALFYSTVFHGVGVMLAAVALSVLAPLVIGLFNVPENLRGVSVFVLRCAAAGTVGAALTQMAFSMLQGLQRFDWYNALALLQNGLMPLGAVAMVALGYGLRGAAGWYVFNSYAVALAAALVLMKVLSVDLPPPRGEGLSLGRFARYSFNLGLGPIAWIITFQCDRLFIANFLPLSDLTIYAVPTGILQRLMTLSAIIGAVLFPILTEIRAGHSGPEELARFYLKSVRVFLWALMPAFVLLFALMPQFLTLWLGPEFGIRSVWPARLLVLSQIFLLMSAAPGLVAASCDEPWYLSAMAWSQAAVSLAAWWWLVPRYRILGAALGSLLAQAVTAAIFIPKVHRAFLKLSPRRFLDEGIYGPFVSASLLLAIVFPLHAHANTWTRLVLLAAAGGGLYYGSTWFLMKPDERELLRKFLRWQPA